MTSSLSMEAASITSPLFQKHQDAREILLELSTKQKVRLLSGASMWTTKEIPDFDIPTAWLCDGPHGLRKQQNEWVTDLQSGRVKATCFPTASCLACSWDRKLLLQVGQAIGRECRDQQVPMVLLGPGINLIRHPCGGRAFEYFSEDPLVTGHLAAALVEGIQLQGVGTSLKHLFCNNQEKWRMVVNVIVDDRTQRELYLRAFQHVVQTVQPWTVMTAYNKVNDQYCSQHSIVNKVMREEWGFQGVVMTDWGAMSNRIEAIQNGIDLEMPGSIGTYDDEILNALQQGTLQEEELDACVVRILSLLLSLKYKNSTKIDNDVSYDAHHDLARQAAVQSIVLLKNDSGLLPLPQGDKVGKIAVIGEFAKEPRFQGIGSSQVNPSKMDNAWDRIQEYANELHYAAGYNSNKAPCVDGDNQINETQDLIKEAVKVATACSVAIVFCGLPEISESESFDRNTMSLPESHNALVEAVTDANPNTIVVLSNGSPVTLTWLDKVPAVFESWLCGQGGSSAVVDLIFGVASPSGKLAQTFPLSQSDVPSDSYFPGVNQQVEYREGLDVGYRYFNTFDRDVMFPFGHGISYTQFSYRNLKVRSLTSSPYDLEIEFDLKNVGGRAGAEVVQCYVHDLISTVHRPHHELKAFTKVLLDPNETQKVVLSLSKESFAFWDTGVQEWIVEPGGFELQIGSSSRDIRLKKLIDVSVGQKSSTKAQESHPPRCFSQHIEDERFEVMIGRKISKPPDVSKIKLSENSLVGDSKHSIIGRFLLWQVARALESNVGNESDKKFAKEVAENMPFRALVLFSRGWMTFPLLKLLMLTINGNYGDMLLRIPYVLMTLLIHYTFSRCFKNKL